MGYHQQVGNNSVLLSCRRFVSVADRSDRTIKFDVAPLPYLTVRDNVSRTESVEADGVAAEFINIVFQIDILQSVCFSLSLDICENFVRDLNTMDPQTFLDNSAIVFKMEPKKEKDRKNFYLFQLSSVAKLHFSFKKRRRILSHGKCIFNGKQTGFC